MSCLESYRHIVQQFENLKEKHHYSWLGCYPSPSHHNAEFSYQGVKDSRNCMNPQASILPRNIENAPKFDFPYTNNKFGHITTKTSNLEAYKLET